MSNDPRPLTEWADEKAATVAEENREIARSNRIVRTQLKDMEEELAIVKRRLDIYEALDAAIIDPPDWLQPTNTGGKKHRAIPTLFLTDIHWGEKVRPEEIDHLNAYDRAIAAMRIERAATGCIKICRDYLSGITHDGLTLMLGGDLLSGDIHDELRETNEEATTESVVGVLEALTPAIRLLADYFGKVHAVAVVGNHGRTTRKPRAKRQAADSYDGLVYRLLAREFSGDKRVTFDIPAGPDAHFSVYNTRYCLTHGNQFRGGSGISGALAPLLLGVHRKRRRDAQAGNPWDVMCCGHFHSSYFLDDLIVGGSVIGYNEYAHAGNLPVEDARASLWLTTPERGITTYMPVHLQDRVSEGWG